MLEVFGFFLLFCIFEKYTQKIIILLRLEMQFCFRIFCIKGVVFFRIFKKYKSSASNCEPAKPTGKFFDNQRNVVRLPDNHKRLLQKTRGPASHPTHINAYQVAKVREYCLQSCMF